MQLTLATTYMAILTTGIFMTILTICLTNKELLIRFGYKLLGLFVLFTYLRFLFPIEFPFTQSIPLPRNISYYISIIRHRLFSIGQQSVSIWFIFECIWGIGALSSFLSFLISYIRDSYYIILYGKNLTKSSPYKELTDKICQEHNRHNKFQVIALPNLDTPRIFGIITPKILLPEESNLSEIQTYYILQHEMTHHFHHDLLLKLLIKIITLIYWWNPFCILLNRQADVILEMRVDDSLTHSNAEVTSAYMHCLSDYASSNIKKSAFSHTFTLGLLPWEDSDLKKRFYLMLNNQTASDKTLALLICFLMLCVYINSYLFIFEGFNTPKKETIKHPPTMINMTDIYVIESSSYFIDNGDGTYDLYSGDMYLETMTTIDGYYSDTPIYTPENNPYKAE